MSTCPRPPAWAVALALVCGACFSPTGQTTEASSDASPSTGLESGEPTTHLTDPPTTLTATEPTTSSSSSGGDTLTGDSDPTGGPCSCDSPTPYCAGDGCVGCQDLAAHGMSCADIDPERPHCDAGGECVGCTLDEQCEQPLKCHPELKTCVACVVHTDCGDTLTCDDGQCSGCVEDAQCPFNQPICDEGAGTCRQCREHSDCPQSACELDVGTCFPPGETRHHYVDPAQPCVDSDCTSDIPCCAAYEAVNNAAAGVEAYHVIHVKAGKQNVPIRLMTTNKRLAVLGEKGVEFTGEPVDTMFFLGDQDDLQLVDSKLFVSRVRIIDNQATSVVTCMSATHLWLDDVEISGGVGNALLTTDCTLTARRSIFRSVSAGITSGAGGVARFENSIFGDMIAGAPLQIVNGGTLDLLYTTVVDKGNVGQGVLKCFTEAPVIVRNSILVGTGDSDIQCAPGGPSLKHTVTTAVGWQGEGLTEVAVDVVPSLFVNYGAGDYHLAAGDLLADSALHLATDPVTDIDGHPRPAGDGVPDFAGADRPLR